MNRKLTARNRQKLRDRVEIARTDIGDFPDVLRLVEKHRPPTKTITKYAIAPPPRRRRT